MSFVAHTPIIGVDIWEHVRYSLSLIYHIVQPAFLLILRLSISK